MCKHLKILGQSKNGLLLYCAHSQLYQLLFGNLNFNFTGEELESFSRYLEQIDVAYWQEELRGTIYENRVPIPTLQNNLMLLLCPQEVDELKILVNQKPFSYRIINFKEVNYKLFMN